MPEAMPACSEWGQRYSITVESQDSLGRMTVIGTLLTLIWTLSPLGGQASLRLLYRNIRYNVSEDEVKYLPTGSMNSTQYGWNVLRSDVLDDEQYLPLTILTVIYSSALLAPAAIKSSPRDIWSNVKIPRREVMFGQQAQPDGWISVENVTNTEDFVTPTGIPHTSLATPPNATARFAVEYEYKDLQCTNYSSAEPEDSLDLIKKSAFIGFHDIEALSSHSGSHQPSVKATMTVAMRNTERIIYSEPWDLRNCSMEQVFLQARIPCKDDRCAVDAIRPSDWNIIARASEGLPIETSQDYFVSNTAIYFPRSLVDADRSTDLTVDRFVRGADVLLDSRVLPVLKDVEDSKFSKRMSIALNTYLQIGQDPKFALISGLTPARDPIWKTSGPYNSGFSLSAGLPFYYMNATATIQTPEEIFRRDDRSMGILFFSSLVVFACGCIHLVVQFRLKALDVMGNVSSQTYDNKYISLPPGACTLDAMDRSKHLYDLVVKLGDVEPGKEAGHIALAFPTDDLAVANLKRSRRYL
ncbi:hypothetical protein B9Z65_1276 [Elsinoe australis]|uniref:Uncharacterized protein n=1 Tax=Elsinoe australis TaxID=40998 RepID=A0A2P7YQ39_9PEZI|nr:hypothetical protein B9Z65_1276 [Elsinoe australis]